ncbi:arsenate reductase (glutaredoxin) [Altibacter sp. HG106]|uniref:arsenate reductase (glutaredoxin) n=1 Tax=Altibacter sp. HG106 TaxID=3023937 RepID=UPI0023502482|nr:arsenate reductase (glutaredoxin) [Altibacter sp. HG106]MDC7993687.1 arsenate reductase (glutaredoxin) [Altibacter sp. HG106]
MNTIIYHNPRCRKSRETLQILEEHGESLEIVKYLETPPSAPTLSELIAMLGIAPIDLVRTNETIWKEQFKGKALTDAEIVNAMVANPKLIERPIVIKGRKAVIGRPPENVKKLL